MAVKQLILALCFFGLTPHFENTSFAAQHYTQNPSHCKLSNNNRFVALTYVFAKSSEESSQKEFHVGWDSSVYEKIISHNKLEVGSDVLVLRCLPPGRWEYIAQGHVKQINGNSVEAEVTPYYELSSQKTSFSAHSLAKGNFFWTPMVGDIVIPNTKTIVQVKKIYPNYPLDNRDVFVKLENGTYSFEISEYGKQLLKRYFQMFLGANGRLSVGGFVNVDLDQEQIPSDSLSKFSLREKRRVESLLRAQAVASFLELEFKLQPRQLFAYGFGDDLKKLGMQEVKTWPNQDVEQGIVIRLMN
ncbi:MAG: hypothetical protein K2X39_04880 [Silvanigrellaceae bacterium]|nr:hypothetical protein [Silvanigrellaceae bacterium]